MLCGVFAFPASFDIIMYWTLFFSKYIFLYCILFDSCMLISKWFRLLLRPKLDPQMGYQKVDPFLKEAIQVWCLFESLSDSKSKRGMVAAITQYLQSHVRESLPLYVYRQVMKIDYISDWTSNDGQDRVEEMLEQAYGPDTLSEANDELFVLDTNSGGDVEAIPWYITMDSAFTNWKDFRDSTNAKRFTHLVNTVVSAGMCSTADLTFNLGNVSLFTPIVMKKQLAAGDVFEAFYEAVSGFMKGGWRVYQTGDVSAFFMEDDKISAFDSMYNEIRSWHGYALAGNLREYTEIDDNEYELRLKKAIECGEDLVKCIKRTQTFERKYVSDRMDRLRDYNTEFTQLRTRGGLRIAPFAVCLFGQSGCGKSSLTNLTANAGLIYNDLSAAKDRIATWADNDKFASAVRSHINAIIFDDFANTKEEFMDFSPAYRLIQVINNIRYLAPMADVFLKGKVSLNPYFCLISTNIEHLNAAKYSNEPESVLRRMYHVKVEPKPEYCEKGVLSKKKIVAKFGHTPCPDAWWLTVRAYTALNKRHVDLAAMVPIEFEGKTMNRVSVKQYLRWVQIESKQHFTEEGQYLANQETVPVKCEKCEMLYCECADALQSVLTPPAKEEEEGPIVLDKNSGELEYYSGVTRNYFHSKSEIIQRYYERGVSTTVLAAERVCRTWERFDYLPERFICHPTVLKVCLIFWKEDIRRSLITGNSFIGVMMLVLMYGVPYLALLWLLAAAIGMYWFTCATIQTYRHMIRNRILELKDVVLTYTKSWQFAYAIIGLGAIGIVLATLRSKFTKLDPNTGLDPMSYEEVQARNDRENPWLVAETVPLPMSEPSKTTTSNDLAASMRTNLVGVVSDLGKTTLGFYITSNFLVVPTHFIKAHGERDIGIKCIKTKGDKVGSSFRDKLSPSFQVAIPDTDYTVCFVTSGGSMKDFRKFLPVNSKFRATPAKLVTREVLGSSLQAVPMLYKGTSMVAHTDSTFSGSYYDLPIDTANGMCMSPIISDTKGSMIMGFHLGGKGRIGGCGTLTIDQVNWALDELSTVDGVVLSASSGSLIPNMGDFPTETFGKSILEGTDIHPRSAVNYLTEGACIDVYGSTSGKATPHSSVCPTIISETISEVFGIPQQWGPPKMKGKGRFPYQATLVHAAVPSLPIGSVLSKSVSSIKLLTTSLRDRIPELFEVGPLSRVATVSGLAGVKFIDPMNFSSSPGFPLTGSKKPLLIELDPSDHPEVGKPRTFTPEVWAEFEKIEQTLRTGKRCYVIWKSCLKDEATKLTKDKVRVFQSAPLVLQLLVRMYFLPIVRIIQMNPILYECAVGVNAEGTEWEELWESAMSKGKERVLAGDYSKYDVRMPAQVTIAAFDILIDIAEKCEGYSEDDLHIMRMMVHEVVYPVMAYNGDLIQLFGTNPSGQNLTVIINSLVNSLLLRSAFFTYYPDGDFKEACSFLTYGDDVIGTVDKSHDKFTHITYADWLADHDMKFTMPDKESTPTHYMREEDVDFLKRKSVYNEDLGLKVGLLSEDSIFKRLHSHLLSKDLTLPVHSALNIESSLHDWFYYGRAVYEDRRAKLKVVANKCGIIHLCPALDTSYDKRVARWRHVYLGEPDPNADEDIIILNPNCGDLYGEATDDQSDCPIIYPQFEWEWHLVPITYVFLLWLWYQVYHGARFEFGTINVKMYLIVSVLCRSCMAPWMFAVSMIYLAYAPPFVFWILYDYMPCKKQVNRPVTILDSKELQKWLV